MNKKIMIEQEVMDSVISAECSILDKGIHILLTSGTYGHVGAISHMEPKGKLQTIVCPTHREAVISENWAKALCERMNCPVTVCCGIHYENITKEQIQQVLKSVEKMRSELLDKIKNER